MDFTRRCGLQAGLSGFLAHWQPAAAETGFAAVSVRAARVFAGHIRTSPNDQRLYRAVTLGNGLRVLLVSDPDATAAAVALSVHVGHYSDPEDLPGLAHFCEHMLFLGTTEYPDENAFRLFLSAYGGSLNAFTSEQDTTYYFDVSPAALQAALSRFASFFKEPLFTPSATARELSAIDSEDAKNRQSDAFRLNQLTKNFAAADHPQHHFGTGNKETLVTEAQRRGIDTRKALFDFFARFYDASLMALCVVGREPADTLQAWVEDAFSGVVGRNLVNPTLAWRGINPYPPLRTQNQMQQVEAVPISDRRALLIAWPILFETEDARLEWVQCKPYVYVSYLLGHEGEGSLLSLLKRLGWADGILVGVSREDDNFAMMRMSFDLTEEGLMRRDDIVEIAYAVIRYLERASIPNYIFQQCRDIREVRWRFKNKDPALNAALGSVELMQRGFTPEDYRSGNLLLSTPKQRSVASMVAALLARLLPDHGQYTTVAKVFSSSALLEERWYKTKYALSDIPVATLRRWRSPPILAEYRIPRPNPFMPEDFSLKNAIVELAERPEAIAEPPTLVQDEPRCRVFFKADRAFASPEASVRIFLWMPADGVDEDAVPSRLWLLCLTDRLTEYFYDAAFGGLNFDISNVVEGLAIDFAGYSDKLISLVQDVLAYIRDFNGPTEGEFQRALDEVRREQTSFDKQQPYQYAAYLARLAVLSPEYTIEFLRKQTASVNRSQVHGFGEKFRTRAQRFFAQVLLQGNLNALDVIRIQDLLKTMPFAYLAKEDLTRVRLAELPPGRDAVIMQFTPNADELNSALWVVFFTDSRPKAVLMCQLLQSILQDSFFNEIRTEQQLGYIVASQVDRFGLVGRLGLAIQSNVKTPDFLLGAVDEFVRGFRTKLSRISEAQFSRYKIAIVEKIVKPDERLDEEGARWWQEITLFEYSWRRRAEEAEVVRLITKTDLLDFFDRFISESASQRRRLVTAVFTRGRGQDKAMATMRSHCEAAGATIVEDPVSFCARLPKFPLVDREPGDSL